ncbi:MAG TPA: tRNA (adenosine(37)-N6)-threonylcarbamoyltransferase complex ATPase subunit type 1 TsaE [Rhabdochlamydiaceae bacterium]|nr:tRNA (adenosine(37)-N6)-threonylcarbamoyltransferase complex ATPase subunit type 1 TsaE [Rhabdochlamydiaceae bacterium]
MRNNGSLKISESAEDTTLFGQKIGSELLPDSIVCLFGDLGAGKTTFIKGIAAGCGNINPREVNSPTFTFLNIYSGLKTIYHFDLYRLNGIDDFLSMGFDEYFHAGGICCIEWSERITPILPKESLIVNINYQDADRRLIVVSKG